MTRPRTRRALLAIALFGWLLIVVTVAAAASIIMMAPGASPDRPLLRGTIDPNGNPVERR